MAWGGDTSFARAVGAVIRRRRKVCGLTQAELGAPMTKGFVSAVELGHVVPSLPALALMTTRLDISLADLFGAVNEHWPTVYTRGHDDRPTQAGRGRRQRSRPAHR
jgi:transcriptional regulator with XRE-family HTH domain